MCSWWWRIVSDVFSLSSGTEEADTSGCDTVGTRHFQFESERELCWHHVTSCRADVNPSVWWSWWKLPWVRKSALNILSVSGCEWCKNTFWLCWVKTELRTVCCVFCVCRMMWFDVCKELRCILSISAAPLWRTTTAKRVSHWGLFRVFSLFFQM